MVLQCLFLVVSIFCAFLGKGDSTELSHGSLREVGDMSAITLGRNEAAFGLTY